MIIGCDRKMWNSDCALPNNSVIVVLVSSLQGTRKTSVEKVSAQKYQTAGRIFWNVSRFISGLLRRLKEDGNSVSPEASNDVTN